VHHIHFAALRNNKVTNDALTFHDPHRDTLMRRTRGVKFTTIARFRSPGAVNSQPFGPGKR
jgi:hypothetical protein